MGFLDSIRAAVSIVSATISGAKGSAEHSVNSQKQQNNEKDKGEKSFSSAEGIQRSEEAAASFKQQRDVIEYSQNKGGEKGFVSKEQVQGFKEKKQSQSREKDTG